MKRADVDTRTSYRKFSHYYLRKINNTKYHFLPPDKNIYSGSRHIGQNTVVTEDDAAIIGGDIADGGFDRRRCVVVEGRGEKDEGHLDIRLLTSGDHSGGVVQVDQQPHLPNNWQL